MINTMSTTSSKNIKHDCLPSLEIASTLSIFLIVPIRRVLACSMSSSKSFSILYRHIDTGQPQSTSTKRTQTHTPNLEATDLCM
eukprot:m.25868 g.25868  ORF g.25868 m.25868 type:complete len:84 (+) comp8776_c0_seq1:834-1085(+)